MNVAALIAMHPRPSGRADVLPSKCGWVPLMMQVAVRTDSDPVCATTFRTETSRRGQPFVAPQRYWAIPTPTTSRTPTVRAGIHPPSLTIYQA